MIGLLSDTSRAADKNGRQATAEVHIVILKEPASILSMLNVTRCVVREHGAKLRLDT